MTASTTAVAQNGEPHQEHQHSAECSHGHSHQQHDHLHDHDSKTETINSLSATATALDGESTEHQHEHHHHHHPSTSPSGFRTPTRALLSKEDLQRWLSSATFTEFTEFIAALNMSVRGRKLSDEVVMSKVNTSIMSTLDELENWVSEIPALENTRSRFGNPAFQTWFDKLQENIAKMTRKFLEIGLEEDPSNVSVPVEELDAAAGEVSTYLLHSFGNRKRIDYGTGHEAHFIAFLLCLKKLNFIKTEDYPAAVLKVFWRYIGVMRALQFTYWLEPAGSHGVWGLDDYHFLPFMFGSSQLTDHKYFKPKCIHDKDVVEEFSKDYMYLSCIKLINSVKTASLRWHSPMIDDISGVKLWSKVNSGMDKMYRAEVLGKLPIMQHFLFGSLLAFEASGPIPGDDDEMAHVHALGQAVPECCFIRVPSSIAVAAAGALKKGDVDMGDGNMGRMKRLIDRTAFGKRGEYEL
ncbi:Serine/threonine-protein phosphatase 2A activator 2 [Blyttiomyces sp. JEL0837]|nr:Serine/threonine-protein phosphatase 2A activator 2 [Blyttiomyces sp. JEL0837]